MEELKLFILDDRTADISYPNQAYYLTNDLEACRQIAKEVNKTTMSYKDDIDSDFDFIDFVSDFEQACNERKVMLKEIHGKTYYW